jgi:hypothetical protein
MGIIGIAPRILDFSTEWKIEHPVPIAQEAMGASAAVLTL